MQLNATEGGIMRGLIGRAILAAVAIFVSATAFASEPEAVPGEYVVKLKNQYSISKVSKATLSSKLGAFVKSVLPEQNIVVVQRPAIETQKNVIKTLSKNALVEIVEPNFIYRAFKTPNDPMYAKLWGMNNTGQPDPQNQVGVAGVDIGAEKAWDIETGNKDLVVAVIDTGIDYNHADLKDNMWTNDAELNGKAGVDDDGNGFVDDVYGYNFSENKGDARDDQGHGSHCAGTIGAKGDDGKGIVGVAWNVKLMSVKFLSASGSGTLENALKAIDYATKMGAKIMSNSWGGGGFSQTLKEAIERSNAAGALFVAAAGNNGTNNDSSPVYPGSYQVPNILSVAAIDNKGQMAGFSCYGRNAVHVGAPGVNVYSSTGGAYASFSGTSMATPHVSGIAALVLSHEPNLTNIQLKDRIIATAKPMQALRGKVKSGGMANAYTALMNILPEPDMNDPANWPAKEVSISTSHNYGDKKTETFEVKIDGAKEVALYFARFATESGYDFVRLYDSTGKLVQTIHGRNDDMWSYPVAGDYVKIVLTSDEDINDYGFDITKVGYR